MPGRMDESNRAPAHFHIQRSVTDDQVGQHQLGVAELVELLFDLPESFAPPRIQQLPATSMADDHGRGIKIRAGRVIGVIMRIDHITHRIPQAFFHELLNGAAFIRVI